MKKIIITCLALLSVLITAHSASGNDFGFGLQTHFIIPHMSLKVPLTDEFSLQIMALPWQVGEEDKSSYGGRILMPLSGWDRGNYRAYAAWGVIWGGKKEAGREADSELIFGIEQKKGASEFAHSFEFGVNWDGNGDVYPIVNYGYHYYF